MKNPKMLKAGQTNSSGMSEVSTHQGGNPASISVTIGKSEVEQILKQMTFTRSEAQHLIGLVHSRTMEESPSPHLRLESSTTNGSIKRHKHEDGQAPRQDSNLINFNATPHPTTMESLPDELLSNIFLRLFAKQLAQMRSVSKSWNALLSHSSFIKSHLHHSIHNNDQILLVFYVANKEHIVPFTTHSSRYPLLELTNFIKLPINPRYDCTRIRIIGAINGLICSRYGDSIIHIWNPSLSSFLTLPPYSTPSHAYGPVDISFRFGYDPKTDDYKVIKLTRVIGPPKRFLIPPTRTIRPPKRIIRPRICVNERWLQVEIYSMRKGSWELIAERFPSHIIDFSEGFSDGSIVSVDGHNGCLHWLGYYDSGGNVYLKTIVAFDLGSETFREIPLPDSTLVYRDSGYHFSGVLGGKLCVMLSDDEYEVWVMDEYGVAESWVKYQFGDDYAYAIGCTDHNVFFSHREGHLCLYDPVANTETMFRNFCAIEEGATRIVEYVDSLVWVTPDEY